MFSTFNMGVGMVLVVDPGNVEEILRRSQHRAFAIGEVVAGSGVHIA
jgi:phosphoribosylaminoimidazole (AIR) synthetase